MATKAKRNKARKSGKTKSRKSRRWGSVSEKNGKFTARWQDEGKRRQKGGFRSRKAAEEFLGEKELELFRQGFLPNSERVEDQLEVAIESIVTMQSSLESLANEIAGRDESDEPTDIGLDAHRDALAALEEAPGEDVPVDDLRENDLVIIELSDPPRRKIHGTVTRIARDAGGRVRSLTVAVRLGSTQIARVIGRTPQS
jgi:hypothetical protein